MSEHDEPANELTYMVRDEPLKTCWLEAAIDGAEQVTAEALSKAIDDAVTHMVSGGPETFYFPRQYAHPGPANPLSFRYVVPRDPLTESDIRALVCKWLRDDPEIRAIIDGEQDGVVDVKHRRRVRQFDEGGYEWRGVLYRVEKEE